MFKRGLLLTLITAVVLPASTPVMAQELSPLLDSAMSLLGRTAADIKFDSDEMATWGGDRFRLNYFSLFHKDPTRLPLHGRLILDDLTADQSSLSGLLARASRFIDQPIRRGLIGDPLEPFLVYPDSMIVPSITRGKNILTGKQYNRLKDLIDLIYRMTDDDEFAFKKSLSEADKGKYRNRLFDFYIHEKEEYHDLVYELVQKVDMARLIAGAQDFAAAANRVIDEADSLTFPDWVVEFKTRSGMIVIGTKGDDHFKYNPPPLLLIDGGGNDTYEIGGISDDYPLSMLIDLGGNDTYLCTDTNSPGVGGAVLGMGVLIDLQGDDRYETSSLSLGAGLFGVGLLYDRQGDDVYISHYFSQGAASFGVGMLVDSAGNDSMYCLTTSQGYGFTGGCGVLFNYAGDDRYVAEDDSVFNPSPQTAEHNASLAQGVGFGNRADYIDGHSWAGGVGILCDAGGNDRYSAGLFAQGTGYWYAVGMLIDGAGADKYNGVWYVQGSAAHFAVGFLDDMQGDDEYTASHNMAQGAGHDFSVGYLFEQEGNDIYHSPNLSLGGGNANGIGIFYDVGGDDHYLTNSGTTLGMANRSPTGLRHYLETFGVFVDGGGNDEYREQHAGNNQRWVIPERVGDDIKSPVIGVGIDCENSSGD